ncbi:hypothetical protein DPMN_140669 [Dreissena polymorpha]|uniref:Uncharacterized protein n=1 Tax=Dreissena polymorpha TaxID=45954 RepID=A0A9D4G815_DREPO|nr:hypothetical protein DPMN_140669 [Dreissena polymorpha]
MLHLRSVIVCAMALAFVVVFCQDCPEPNQISDCVKDCPPDSKELAVCITYWCCKDLLNCKCVDIKDLVDCKNRPTPCKKCCIKPPF